MVNQGLAGFLKYFSLSRECTGQAFLQSPYFLPAEVGEKIPQTRKLFVYCETIYMKGYEQMKEQLEKIEQLAKQELSSCDDIKALENLKIKFLGKKGELTAILKQMGKLTAEERPVIGQLANKVREDIENAVSERVSALKSELAAKKMKEETLDVTLPGKTPEIGRLHPLTVVMNEVKEIFLGMGFEVVDGPEVETDHYCF